MCSNTNNGGIKSLEFDNKLFEYDNFGGCKITDNLNGCTYYLINDNTYKSREEYCATIRDEKLKELGI